MQSAGDRLPVHTALSDQYGMSWWRWASLEAVSWSVQSQSNQKPCHKVISLSPCKSRIQIPLRDVLPRLHRRIIFCHSSHLSRRGSKEILPLFFGYALSESDIFIGGTILQLGGLMHGSPLCYNIWVVRRHVVKLVRRSSLMYSAKCSLGDRANN